MNTMKHIDFRKKKYVMLYILLFPLAMLLLTGEYDLTNRGHNVANEIPVWRSQIPDFSAINDLEEKKSSFFEFIRPEIEIENARVLAKRERLLDLYKQYRKKIILSLEEKEWLEKLKAKYRVNGNFDDPELAWIELIRRVDILPVELALTQAAKESGWGTSRFARRGNNIFGQWCFKEGCGIVPINREEGASHEVQKFESVNGSVRSYIHNLNTHDAYEEFRQLRFEQRRVGKKLDGYPLVSGLPRYSERGEAYLEEIRDMMLANMDIMASE
ncbi:MAG: glucosaminidase domain-containing protein [Nitrospira sp.]|nr:glucosaminidase domain-containing protein [Nitrospira sp.]